MSVALSSVLSRQRVPACCDPNGKSSLSGASPLYTVVEFPWNRNSVWIAVAVMVASLIVSVWAMISYMKYLGMAKNCF